MKKFIFTIRATVIKKITVEVDETKISESEDIEDVADNEAHELFNCDNDHNPEYYEQETINREEII